MSSTAPDLTAVHEPAAEVKSGRRQLEIEIHNDGRPMVARRHGERAERSDEGSPNWVLPLAVVLCLAFWIYVTSTVAQQF